MEYSINDFKKFLIDAKKATYASQGDDASVVPYFNGSKQLEYQMEDFKYRDIYYGTSFFIGQEVVEYKEKPIWSMIYSGGIIITDPSKKQTFDTYRFLREAMKLVDLESLYRGPRFFEEQEFFYKNDFKGQLDNFWGVETIEKNGFIIYELRYSGGNIKD